MKVLFIDSTHPILYSIFEKIGWEITIKEKESKEELAEIRQWIKTTDEQNFEIDFQDLRKIKNQESRLKDLIQLVIEKTFDLETGPLISTQLIQLTAAKYIFSFVIHQLVCIFEFS